MKKAECYQPGIDEKFEISPSADLFIRLPNGKSIRLCIDDDSISIYKLNGIKISVCCKNNAAGVKITK
jgi:hypothetical protein